MNTYYQFMIYDTDREDCYIENGVIVEVSNLYTDKNACEEVALQACKDYDNMYVREGRFQYEITEVEVVK